MASFPGVISLNVGGRHFATTLATLRKYEDSMLAAMFSGRHHVVTDKDGCYFIDRDGSHFGHILEFLRHDKLPPPKVAKGVYEDAEFYGLQLLSEKLKQESASLFLETISKENEAKFFKAYPELASLTSNVLQVAHRKCQQNPRGDSSVVVCNFESVDHGHLFPSPVTIDSIHAGNVRWLDFVVVSKNVNAMRMYLSYTRSYFQQCGYKVDVQINYETAVKRLVFCPACPMIISLVTSEGWKEPSLHLCPTCQANLTYVDERKQLKFTFAWSHVDIHPTLKVWL